MMGSMLLFTREIQIANTALDVHLFRSGNASGMGADI